MIHGGGSYYVERLTHDLANRAWKHITEIEEAGGMAKAIDLGIPKLRIEEAAETQARIDSGVQPVIGVNKFRLDKEEDIEILQVDNSEVRQQQIDQLVQLNEERNEEECQQALERLTNGASQNGNLLALSIDAAREFATVGEISDALEKVFGRHKSQIQIISGVYRGEVGENNEQVKRVRAETKQFSKVHGRRPKSSLLKLGKTGTIEGKRSLQQLSQIWVLT